MVLGILNIHMQKEETEPHSSYTNINTKCLKLKSNTQIHKIHQGKHELLDRIFLKYFTLVKSLVIISLWQGK